MSADAALTVGDLVAELLELDQTLPVAVMREQVGGSARFPEFILAVAAVGAELAFMATKFGWPEPPYVLID